MDEQGSLFGDSAQLRTTYAYGVVRRAVVAVAIVAILLPLVYVVLFALVNPPAGGNLGPFLIALLFFLVPPAFVIFRFGHYFRQYRVERHRLAVSTLWHRWAIEWSDVSRIVRRTRISQFGDRSYRVRLELELPDGSVDWVSLFDSALPGADELYVQILRHTPHVRPKEIEDDASFRRGAF